MKSIDSEETEQIAITKCKRDYDYRCIFTGKKTQIDGCHIYPKSLYPELRNYKCNIVPGNRIYHTGPSPIGCIDYFYKTSETSFTESFGDKPLRVHRPPCKRIKFIAVNCHSMFIEQFKNQVYDLLLAFKVQYPNKKEQQRTLLITRNFLDTFREIGKA